VILDQERILEIHAQAVAASLHTKRNQMLFGVSVEYVAGLDLAANPSDQLLSDLAAMNEVGTIIGGVPLERWLRNAEYAMSARPDKQRFFRELADKVARTMLPHSEPPAATTQQERILFVSDLLPVGFLAAAARVGKSVGRLTVPRFEAGQAHLQAASGDPILFYGTGWLVGPKHVITNYHVVNARYDGEAPAEQLGSRTSGPP
jgi:endonuclease G, mitochondrial